VSLDGLVEHVAHVLGRGHALFSHPHPSGARIQSGEWGLAGVADQVRGAGAPMREVAGALPAHYTRWSAGAARAMDTAIGTDRVLSGRVRAAGHADGAGWTTTATVIDGAATDTAGLGPVSHTPAGQRALVAALRSRLAQQQHVVDEFQARDARLAQMVRALRYPHRGTIGAIPLVTSPFGGQGLRVTSLPMLAGLPGLAGGRSAEGRDHRGTLADWWGDPHTTAVEPGMDAARAAVSKVGCPYVWGAKGPTRFDCSGLTQWAWRQAGVTLGADTYAQINDGVAVPAGQVRAGDLIFPLDSFGRAGPGHVQLAVSDHQVVHAPQPGDVVRLAAMPTRYIARRPLRSAPL
jgi:peptidoglycan DL-endopeptidase CwlO